MLLLEPFLLTISCTNRSICKKLYSYGHYDLVLPVPLYTLYPFKHLEELYAKKCPLGLKNELILVVKGQSAKSLLSHFCPIFLDAISQELIDVHNIRHTLDAWMN